MKIRRPARWAASVCAAGALLVASACQSSGEGSEGSEGSESEAASDVDPVATEIRGWDDACAVLDPDSIAEQLGAEYDEDGPVHVGLDEGMFIGAITCNALFRVESDPDQQQGFMYLHISPSDNAEIAKTQYDELWEQDFNNANENTETQFMLSFEEDVAGDWDDADLFVTTGFAGDRVWAYFLDGAYLVQIQLQWGPDLEMYNAALRGEEDLSEFAEFGFTPLDIGGWVRDTYLPQVHQTITDKIAEGTGA